MRLGTRTFLTLEICVTCRAQRLDLSINQIGDAGMAALADACAKGSMAKLEKLYLGRNKIGDSGVSALADACAKGFMASLKELYVNNAGTKHPALKAACQARGIKLLCR